MYTSKVFRHLVWGALVLGVSQAQGQVSVPGHLPRYRGSAIRV